MTTTRRKGFTLLEVVVSVAIGAIILSGAMTLYTQGNKYFYKATEHSSFRSEALWMLEYIGQDLDQLQVSAEDWPGGSASDYYLLEPYRFIDGFEYDIKDDEGNPTGETVKAGKGLIFHRFHHVEAAPASSSLLPGAPRLVAHKITYTQEPIDASDPSKGVNLLRNGRKINHVPLKEVIFHQQPLIVAAGQLHATKHSIITAIIVPNGGTFGTLASQETDFDVLERLAEEGSITSRTYHLAGFESFYTSILVSEIQRRSGGTAGISGMSDLHQKVYAHAQANVGSGQLAAYQAELSTGGSPPTHNFPPDLFVVKNSVDFNDEDSSQDGGWITSDVLPGKAGMAGEWEIPPGSGSGSGESPVSGSGSSG